MEANMVLNVIKKKKVLLHIKGLYYTAALPEILLLSTATHYTPAGVVVTKMGEVSVRYQWPFFPELRV